MRLFALKGSEEPGDAIARPPGILHDPREERDFEDGEHRARQTKARMSLLILSITATVASVAAFAADRESEFRGRRIAEANCASCHAIALHDESAVPDAPAFRTIAELPSFARIRRELAGELFRRHPEMPDFEPSRDQADDIADYIESLRN